MLPSSAGCVLIHGMNTVTELAGISLVIVTMHRGGPIVARSSMVRNVQVLMTPGHVWLCRLSNIVKLLLKMLRDN